jgi:hypothetical protein
MFALHTYVLEWTPPPPAADERRGPKKTLRAVLASDEEAKQWARWIVEKDGGSIVLGLKDGTSFTLP